MPKSSVPMTPDTRELNSVFGVLQALEEGNFDLDLTAEKLGITPSQLFDKLGTEHESSILSRMRMRAGFEMYKLWKDANLIFLAALAEGEPGDVIRAHNNLSNSVAEMFKAPAAAPIQSNQSFTVLNMLPPETREVVMGLIAAKANLSPNLNPGIADASPDANLANLTNPDQDQTPVYRHIKDSDDDADF